jgi:hypothetical protein
MWRLLENGEPVVSGDEVWVNSARIWVPVAECCIKGKRAHKKYGPIRRAARGTVQGENSPDSPVQKRYAEIAAQMLNVAEDPWRDLSEDVRDYLSSWAHQLQQ